MRLPIIQGVIERRILVNYRIDPAAMARCLPPPFRPQLVGEWAIGGICLIRLAKVRPRGLPASLGVRSENAAHRMAVEWTDGGQTRTGVYIPRRDTDSRLNAWAGGRLFPGTHHLADFQVAETDRQFAVSVRSRDGGTAIDVAAEVAESLPETSAFSSLPTASQFFACGSVGYSDAARADCYDGLQLHCRRWEMTPLQVQRASSSYFEDPQRFPPGSVALDCALLMCSIEHEWHDCGKMTAALQPAG